MNVTINIVPPCKDTPLGGVKVATVPIDDTICVPKPPTTGTWKLRAVNGVIETPVVWIQE